jgi:tetratricopeptide (TPR) repeat protein
MTRRVIRRLTVTTLIWGAVLAVFLAVVHYGLPAALPALWQRLLGLVCTVLAVVVYVHVTQKPQWQDELISRVRRGQHLDFGKELRAEKQQRRTVDLPILGTTTLRAIGAVGVFVVVAAWWLTPWAPVVVKAREIADLATPLTDEILAVVLVLPEGHLPLAQPPTRPLLARRLAKTIPEDAAVYQLALKAVAEGRYDAARQLLDAALKSEDVEPVAVHVALAQNALYAREFSDAIDQYREALTLKPDDPMILCQAAVASLHAGRFGDAQSLIDRAVRICREEVPEEPLELTQSHQIQLARSLQIQAAIFVARGRRLDEAERCNKQAQDLWSEAVEQGTPGKAASFNNHAVLFTLRADFAGARNMSNLANDIWTTMEAADTRVAVGLGNRAACHCLQGHCVDAQEAGDDALMMLRNTLPPGHPVIAIGMNRAAATEIALGQYQQAKPLVDKALAEFEKKFGARHPSVVAALETVANRYAGQACYAKAANYHSQAVTLAQEILGVDHPFLINCLNNLAELHLRRDHVDRAETICKEAQRIAEKTFGQDHPSVARCMDIQGKVQLRRGRADKARPLFEEALDLAQRTLGETHPQVADTLANLAALDNSPRTYTKGVTRYRRAIEIYEQLLGEHYQDHPALGRLQFDLARLYMHVDKYDKAEPHLARALEIREKILAPFHPDLATTLETQAELLGKRDPSNVAEIDALRTRAKEIRHQHAREDRTDTVDAN